MALSIKPYIENKERIHLIGIGGVSMNSLGELLLSKGCRFRVPTVCAPTSPPVWRRSAQKSPTSTSRRT